MPFSAITSGEITSGKPVSTVTQNKIKDNFDNHEDRIQDLEVGASSTELTVWRVNGSYGVAGAVTRVFTVPVSYDFTITGVRILIDKAGSSGTTEINILRKRGVGSYESIFSTRPSVAFGAGDDALSSNAVLDATKVDIEGGDILRFDITSVQTGGFGFAVRIDYNRS